MAQFEKESDTYHPIQKKQRKIVPSLSSALGGEDDYIISASSLEASQLDYSTSDTQQRHNHSRLGSNNNDADSGSDSDSHRNRSRGGGYRKPYLDEEEEFYNEDDHDDRHSLGSIRSSHSTSGRSHSRSGSYILLCMVGLTMVGLPMVGLPMVPKMNSNRVMITAIRAASNDHCYPSGK